MTDVDPNEWSRLIIGIGPGVWDDVDPQTPMMTARIIRAALLPGGTEAGLPTVEILCQTADGVLIHANTTWRLWQGATNAFATDASTWDITDPDAEPA